MNKADLAVYLFAGSVCCLMLIVDAGAPPWLAVVISVVTVLAGAAPVARREKEPHP